MLKAQGSLPIIPTNDTNNFKSVYRQDTTRSRTSSNSENSDNSNDSDNSDNSDSSSFNSINSTSTSASTDRGENKTDISSTARHRLSMQQPQPLGHLPVTEHDHGHDIADPLQADRDHSRNDPPPPSNTKGSGRVGGDHPTVETHAVDPLLAPLQDKEESQKKTKQNQPNDRSHPVTSLHSMQFRHTPSVSTPSSSRQPIHHLTDMGPLEIEREIDSGVHLNHEGLLSDHHHQQRQHNQRLNVEAASLSDQNHPSSSTLVSNRSSHSVETMLGDGKIDPRGSEDQSTTASSSARTTWSGDHPLLTDFTAEPDSFHDPDTTLPTSNGPTRETRLTLNHPHLRHKGHSMSVDQYPGSRAPHEETSFFASGSTTRRRRQARGDPDRSSGGTSATSTSTSTRFGARPGSRDDNDTGTEAIGKRVIIHQVSITDTLAGIALYYGIQVPILKKSNKLWTNDSIHTRKYLYIPVDECSVVKQAGVTIDEGSNTVLLPQRAGTLSISPQHSRSGSATEYYGSSSSAPGSRRTTFVENEPHFQASLPPLPGAGGLSSGAGTAPMAISPRLGIWAESKSVIAPPVPSPTITTTTLSTESHGSTLSPRTMVTSTTSKHSTSFSSTAGGPTGGARVIRRRSSIGVPFSEHLPNTVMVAPTMTHEALAARFKEMDLITERKMSLGQEQELRTNPIHHRHRTTDLRQQARSHSASSSNAGSRRASLDVEAMDSTTAGVGVGVGGRLARRTTILSMIGDEDGLAGMERDEHACEYDEPEEDEDAFVIYGRHQHIYMDDEDKDVTDSTLDYHHRNSDSEVLQQQSSEPTVRRQELITVPAGVLSFFPSPQHSKRLETPQSISRLQNRTDSYRYESSTQSSASSSLSGGRGTRRRDGDGERRPSSRGRKSIDEHTFQAPVPPSTRIHPSAISNASNTTTTTTVRVNSVGPKWSLVSDSIVEDILGAVRGPFEIARRLYVSGFSFGTEKKNSSPSSSSSSSKGYNQSSSSANGLGRRRSGGSQRRRVSSSGGGRRLGHGARSGSTGSGSAIELDTSIGSSRPRSGSRRMPSSSSSLHGENVEGLPSTGESNRRKSTSSGGGSAMATHTPAASSTTTTITGSLGSVRKRSLRSSKPVNHAALKALVNELDRDKKRGETEREKGSKESPAPASTASASASSSMDPLGSSAPTIRFVE